MTDALLIGKAAEHMVCADLLLSGFHTFLADQGSPFDVVTVVNNRLVRIQVKSTVRAVNVNARGRVERIAYTWHVRQRGKGGAGVRLNENHCDMIAAVALDLNAIAYFPLAEVGQCLQLSPPGTAIKTGGSRRPREGTLTDYPFMAALARMGA